MDPSSPESMENKRKHLEFIQAVINRMANTSFLLKGWSITVIAGLFALSTNERAGLLAILALVLTIVFWFLDAYFLWQERLYRELYNYVRKLNNADIDFSMDATRFSATCKLSEAPWSRTLVAFYGPVLVCVMALFFIQFIP
jgi:hypothetical protein